MARADELNVESSHMQGDGMTQPLKWNCFYKPLAHMDVYLDESVLVSTQDLQSCTASNVVAFKCVHTNLELVNNAQNQIH